MLGESLRERFGERPEVPIRHEAIKLLASETRLGILKLLDKRRMTVSELARALELNKSTVHEHLAKLVEGGLLVRDESPEREWVYYDLTKTARYVLQPASARFVLLMGAAVAAGFLVLALMHVLLTAGQGLALYTEEPVAQAGEAKLWSVDVTRPGVLGLRAPVEEAQLYLLSAEQAADYQFTRALPEEARRLGPAEDLQRGAPGEFRFTASLAPGVHYLLAVEPGTPSALLPLRAEAVEVQPRQPTVLVGVDPPQVEVAVRFRGGPVPAGLVEALGEDGRELAQVPVLNGRAVFNLQEAAGKVSFRFKPAAERSAFAAALGSLQAPRPHVAFEPSQVPVLVPAEVRVVVDDPVLGPRAGAPVTLVTPDGRAVAAAATNETGSGHLEVRLTEPGELILKAGALEVGRIVAKPGLRVWLEPGPHWEGDTVLVRSLLMGREPQAVAGTSILLDGRELGTTGPDGELELQFGLGGRYVVEARREGYVPGSTVADVLPKTGFVLSGGLRAGFTLGLGPAPGEGPARVEVAQPRLLLGDSTRVRALLRNPDSLERVLAAELREDGGLLEARAVSLGPGEAAWVGFEYTPRATGVHDVQVNDLAARQVEVVQGSPEGGSGASRAVPGAPAPALLLALAGAALAVAVGRRRC